MGFPTKKEIEEIMEELKKVDPTYVVSDEDSKLDKLKYELCKIFVTYIQKNNISQKDLAKNLGIDPARLNEIVKYKIESFTVDRLLSYAEKLKPEIQIKVA